MANLIPTAVRNTPGLSRVNTGIDMSQFNKFPGLDQKYVDEIEERTKGVPALYKDSMQQQMYSDYYQQQQMDEQQGQRLSVKNGAIQRAMNSSDKEERDLLNTEVRKADLADLIRRKYNISTTAGDDDAIIDKFVSQVPNGAKLYWQYMEGKNADLLSKSGIISPIFAQLNEQNKVKFNNNVVKQEDMEQTNLVSSSQFDNPDYANQYLKEQDSSYDKFINQAKSQGYSEGEIASIIDGSKKYQEYLKQVEEYKNRPLSDKIGVGGETPLGYAQGFANFFINTYNNLLGENPTVGAFKPVDKVDVASGLKTSYDPTGEMRANSWWTKGGDIAGGITAGILTDTALLKLLPGMQVENLTSEGLKEIAKESGKQGVKQAIVDRTIQGAAQGGLGGFVGSASAENPQQAMKRGIPIGMGAGALAGYMQAQGAAKDAERSIMDELDELKKNNPDVKEYVDTQQKDLRTKYEQGVKPSGRGKKTTADYDKSIDDGIRGTEVIVKNKDGLKFIDADGEEVVGQLPKNNQEFSEAIVQTKKNIYDQYHKLAQEAGEKNVKVSTKSAIDELTKLRNDKVTLAGNDGLKGKIDQRIDDLREIDGMSPEDAERKIAELNKKLDAFVRNGTSNDVSNDALNFLIRNNLKTSLDDSIESALGEGNAYKALRNEYSYLRNIEKDVNQRALVQARRNGVGLVDSIANIESADDFIRALAGSKEGAGSFILKQGLKKWISWKNNPDRYVKELFEEVDNIVSQSHNRADLYNTFGDKVTEEIINRAGGDVSKIEMMLGTAGSEVVEGIKEQIEQK